MSWRSRSRNLAVALSFLALGGCAIATPFQGPGFDAEAGVAAAADARLLVVVTEADLGGTWFERRTFWRNVTKVEASLADRPGFIGHAKRTEVFGSKAWTMTVWTDEAAMHAFVTGDVHQRAIAESYPALAGARFARLTVASTDVPVSWDRALAALAADGRSYD